MALLGEQLWRFHAAWSLSRSVLDTLGSIRIPAAACGLVAAHTCHTQATLGTFRREDQLDINGFGVISKNLRDARLAMEVLLHRSDLGQSQRQPIQLPRVGLLSEPPFPWMRVDEEVLTAIAQTRSPLKSAGVQVKAVFLPHYYSMHYAWVLRWLALAVTRLGHDDMALEERSIRHRQIGSLVRPLVHQRQADTWRERALAMFEDVDVIIAPIATGPSPPAVTWAARSWSANLPASIKLFAFTAPWSLAGLPGLVVPLGLSPATGIPISAQLIGRSGKENELFTVAELISQGGLPSPRTE